MKNMKLKFSVLAKFLFSILIIFQSIFACSNPTDELNKFLTKTELNYEKIAFELGEAYWNFYSAEAETDLKIPKKKFYNLLINDTLNTKYIYSCFLNALTPYFRIVTAINENVTANNNNNN